MYSIKNGDTLDARGMDDPTRVLWKCSCNCYLLKSRHAVANNIRDHAPGEHTCFLCPAHGANQPASKYAWWAWATVLSVLEGPFDLWLHPYKLVVEVDGEHHFKGAMYGRESNRQQLRDRRKEQAACKEGYHVVRLHYLDRPVWPVDRWSGALMQGLLSARQGAEPCVHRSPSYLA